ncbi:hypothetical protein PN498_06035 [Oscillatoria sp. CS-180]|uniref:hypothetical protein n=1 Tax=Oscillatoria sp. CS-180 TaxID=3021720 RepID=UPI00232B85A1|nr:hypothetical protein [Oscillatoria sp. CS-180]MDB9525539.1 hypothetical protein [Oscillatoria sp. CS-180]
MDEGLISRNPEIPFWNKRVWGNGNNNQSFALTVQTSYATTFHDATHALYLSRSDESVILPTAKTIEVTSPSLDVHHASPLAELREGDRQALEALFDFDNDLIQDITLDVHRYLARMYPEPCWEDEPHDFLHGYV